MDDQGLTNLNAVRIPALFKKKGIMGSVEILPSPKENSDQKI
jgi:hypothetical protein